MLKLRPVLITFVLVLVGVAVVFRVDKLRRVVTGS
jgi:hypothetical protein